MIFKANALSDIEKAFNYAKRIIETAKFGITIEVSKKKTLRSINQNAYYWGIVIQQISDEWGYFPNEVHQILKIEFLKIDDVVYKGKTFPIVKSTTKLKTDEFEEYLEKCRMWASINLEICILLPNECESMWDYSHKNKTGNNVNEVL